MKKGQAFDTFKLMIAAVIAVAILGILLGILGSISTPGADPASAVKEQLSKANQFKASTFVSSARASFTKGTIYSQSTFLPSIGGYGTIDFDCGSFPATLCVGGAELQIMSDFQAKIKVCCDSSNDCQVGIGEDSSISC